jgi:hypothetical protein
MVGAGFRTFRTFRRPAGVPSTEIACSSFSSFCS